MFDLYDLRIRTLYRALCLSYTKYIDSPIALFHHSEKMLLRSKYKLCAIMIVCQTNSRLIQSQIINRY